MADFTNTEASAVIPELWDSEILQARYAEAQIMKRFLNKADVVKGKGDILHIPVLPRFDGGTVGADGTFTPEANTITDVSLTVDTWREVSIDVLDRAQVQSFADLLKVIPANFGKRLAEFVDTDLAALHTGWTTDPTGSTTEPSIFDDDKILASYFKLANTNIPKDGLSWVLSPEAFYFGLFIKDRWTQADSTGLPKSVLQTNFRYPILGVPAYETTLVATSGLVKKCFLGHREAIAAAMQTNNKTDIARRVAGLKLSTVVVTQNLYGVATVRATHINVVNIKAGA